MKNIFVLRYFMLVVAVFTASFQSFHIVEHCLNASKEIELQSHDKKSTAHYNITDCSICSVVLHSSSIKEDSFCSKTKAEVNTNYRFSQPKEYYHLFSGIYFSLRAPPLS